MGISVLGAYCVVLLIHLSLLNRPGWYGVGTSRTRVEAVIKLLLVGLALAIVVEGARGLPRSAAELSAMFSSLVEGASFIAGVLVMAGVVAGTLLVWRGHGAEQRPPHGP